MKKGLLLAITICLMIPLAKASHVVGGDIQIEWVSQNNYRLKLRFYRDDITGAVAMPANMTITVYEQGTMTMITNQTLPQVSLGIVTLGDACYQPDPNVVRIQEGIYESTVDLFLPDNPNGYYLSATENARNALSTNVVANGTMVWLALMADPAIGQNSSPDFGDYPADAYFCVNSPKLFTYPITDADGDSLAYSFSTPLNTPQSAVYPFYANLGWAAGYSLANIIGGTPMTINPTTGQIIANPAIQDFFTFAVRVEEFRDTSVAGNMPKVKVGEVRRDVQYQSQPCVSGNAPFFVDPSLVPQQIVQFEYNRESCMDFVMEDINVNDTIYMEMISDILPDSGAYQVNKIPDASNNISFYTNWNGTYHPNGFYSDTTVTDTNWYDPVLGLQFNEGTMGLGFCWTPQCDQVGQLFPFQVNGFSLGCDGLSLDSLPFFIRVVAPVPNLAQVNTKVVPYGTDWCRNITFQDFNLVDLLDLTITSPIFNEGAVFPNVGSNFTYDNNGNEGPTVNTGVPNDANNTQTLATRFCWTPDCQHIGGTFPVRAVLTSVDCPTAFVPDTMEFNIEVTPAFDSLDVIPNVITPNGDGINDFYTFGYTDELGVQHGGTSNFCEDFITIEIFNRWGQSIFTSDEPTFKWYGTNKGGGDVPAGTYFVLVTGVYGDEPVTLDQRSVTVIR